MSIESENSNSILKESIIEALGTVYDSRNTCKYLGIGSSI